MTCTSCGHEVPAAPFCVVCGAPLENRDSPYPHERRGYAAAPHEHWFVPRIVSSLFPHLPSSDMRGFRIALLAGAGLIVGLGLFALFPLALIVAAVLVPALTVLYLWDVDLYEDEPAPMLAFTIVWGAAGGAVIGYAARRLASPVSLLSAHPSAHDVIWLGALLPLVGIVVMVAGPLVLLPYRRFNDVLDGATFGGACAVTFVGAEVIANSATFLSGGLKAPGDEALWITRLLTLGVALPVLAAGAVGAVCGAFWLRYRGPAGDRGRLGPAGSPFVALPLAAAAVVGANLCELYLGEWSTLAVSTVLAAVALIGLRRVIDLGLRQEAAEREIGAPARCANCGRDTPQHSFCAQCGVALRALPKTSASALAPGGGARLSNRVRLIAFGSFFVAAGALSILLIVLVRPGAAHPSCTTGVPCGSPPELPLQFSSHLARAATPGAYEPGQPWASPLGVRLRYDSKLWRPLKVTDGSLFLEAENRSTGDFVLTAVIVTPSSEGPEQLLQQVLDSERDAYLGFARDTSPEHVLLGPEIGGVDGIGAMYSATLDDPPSPTRRLEFAFQASSAGGVTVLVEAVTDIGAQARSEGSSSPFPVFALVDQVTGTIDWPET